LDKIIKHHSRDHYNAVSHLSRFQRVSTVKDSMSLTNPSPTSYNSHSYRKFDVGRICMEGGIYSRQKCPICKKTLKHDERRKGCFCLDHKEIAATRFEVQFPGGIYQRHCSYESAEQSLLHLRYEKRECEGRFDPQDYRTTRPNSFKVLAPKYLLTKKSLANYSRIKSIIENAAEHFGHCNIRDISGGDIEDYLYGMEGISEKTRFNRCSQLHDFWMWSKKRGKVITLAEFPDFPVIDFELGTRKITNWETQEKVISKVKEISYHINPKIWLGIDMLGTYTKLRPDDLRRVTESSLDNDGILTIHYPTKLKNKFKTLRLHPDHVDEWKALQKKYPALSGAYFFRHTKGIPGCTENERFGDKYLYKWWNKAAAMIGLEGVPLYPGTKHTTATETAKLLGSKKAEEASGLTNKAFKRYCQIENDGIFEVVTTIRRKKKGEVLPFTKSKRED